MTISSVSVPAITYNSTINVHERGGLPVRTSLLQMAAELTVVQHRVALFVETYKNSTEYVQSNSELNEKIKSLFSAVIQLGKELKQFKKEKDDSRSVLSKISEAYSKEGRETTSSLIRTVDSLQTRIETAKDQYIHCISSAAARSSAKQMEDVLSPAST